MDSYYPNASSSAGDPDPERVRAEIWSRFRCLFDDYNLRRRTRGLPELKQNVLARQISTPSTTFNTWWKNDLVPPDFGVLTQAAVHVGGDEEEWSQLWRQARQAHEQVLERNQTRSAQRSVATREPAIDDAIDDRSGVAASGLLSPPPERYEARNSDADRNAIVRASDQEHRSVGQPATDHRRLRITFELARPVERRPAVAAAIRPWASRGLLMAGLLWLVGPVADSKPAPTVGLSRPAACAYVTALPAPVMTKPSPTAEQVKNKDLGAGVEILPRAHPTGWWPVYTPHDGPGYAWMRANALSRPFPGSRPCLDEPATAEILQYNITGTAEQFTVGGDCHIYHRWQNHPNGRYSQWVALEGWRGCALSRNTIAVIHNTDGALDVFIIGSDHAVWHTQQTRPGSGPWRRWTSLIGANSYSGLRVLSGTAPMSRIQVFTRDRNGQLWENQQTQSDCDCWSGWHVTQ